MDSEENKVQLPKFLSKKTAGQDDFEGKSQENIATVISTQIIENPESHKMIGIEGSWGSGKSNLLEILKKKLGIENNLSEDEKFVYFLYDVWAHQEDIQRKSILTELINKLCDLKLLKQDKWSNKVKEISATIVERTTKSIPKFNWGMIVVFFVIIVSPVLEPIADSVPKDLLWLKILILTSPVILIFLQIIYYAVFDSLSNFICIYKDKEVESSNTEFTHESNPSVSEFNDFMKKLSEELKERKLILVFDNMDRLPIEKVKDLWSSIHTFFAETEYKNIITIVTFDRKHIREAFTNGDTSIGDDYINKTFDIVYRVSLPVINDWKVFLKKNWSTAFGKNFDETEYNRVEQAYDMLSKKDNYTPRSIINFINEIVSIKLVLKKNIPERYIAIFVLTKNKLLENSFNAIIEKAYLGSLDYIYKNDDNLDRYMTALVYQIDPDKSLSIVYTQQLTTAIEKVNKSTIDIITKSSFLTTIINDSIQNVNSIENLILSIDYMQNKLPESFRTQIWSDINEKVYLDEEIIKSDTKLLDYQKCLLKNSTDESKRKYTKNLIIELETKELFNAIGYFNIISNLYEFVDKDYIESILTEKKLEVAPYIEFIKHAKENESNVKISCDTSALDTYLLTLDVQKIMGIDYLQFIPTRYELKNFNIQLNRLMVNERNNLSQFSKIVNLLKIINKQTVNLSNLPMGSYIGDLYAQSEDDFKYDLIAISLKRNYINPSIETVLNGIEDRNISGLSICIEHYLTFGEVLLGLKTNSKYELYKKVCCVLIDKEPSSNQYLNINEILKSFSMICSAGEISPERLLLKLNTWNTGMSSSGSDITNILNLNVLKSSMETKCDLSTKCIKYCKEYLESYTEEKWEEGLWDFSKYGIKEALTVNFKLNSSFINALTSVFKQIAQTDIAISNNKEDWERLLLKVGSLSTVMKNIRDEFCSGRAVMSNEKFLFFGNWLFEKGNIEENKDSLRTIIPCGLLDNDDCVEIIIKHKSIIKEIVDKTGDDAEVFKQKIVDSIVSDENSILKPLFEVLELTKPSITQDVEE